MKKRLFLCALAALLLTGCQQKPNNESHQSETPEESETDVIGSEVTETEPSTEDPSESETTEETETEPVVTSLEAPKNLRYEDGVISFDEVENALEYVLTIMSGNIVKHEKSYSKTSIDISFLELVGGNYLAKVKAKRDTIFSEESLLDFKILHVDVDKILEAESALLDIDRNYSGDANAHGGAYGLAFNDCGQGMYFRYYAFEAGLRDVTIAYATGMPNSFMTLFANNHNYIVTFTENTNWFGDAHVMANVTINNVEFIKGWNELYLIKNGTGSDNPAWGGYVQIDYISIQGTNKTFDLDEFDMTSKTFNLEAEMAHWHWNNTNQRPNNWGNPFSLGFGCGEMNSEDDGVRFDINIPEAGKYLLRPVLGGNKDLFVRINDGNYIEKNFGDYSEYNVLTESIGKGLEIEFTSGNHRIDIIRNNNWFTLDKVILEKVVEE